jgi:TPP-dependent pyruvate/acetoin dehydrogenase alpha subunit
MSLKSMQLAMIRIRAWQHILNEELKKNTFKIPIHLAFGYEALSVSLKNETADQDKLVLPHRNISYQLAFLGRLQPIYDEFLGNTLGIASGALGSMNLAGKNSQIQYTTSILGNGLPVSCGFALSQKVSNSKNVTFTIVGDGAIEEGACYESMLFARSQKLPLIIILENNDQSMSSSILERRSEIDWQKFTESIDLPYFKSQGNSLTECLSAISSAREFSSSKSLPCLIEVDLFAFNQHAGSSPGWPSDPKDISIRKGPFLDPYDLDPVSQIASIEKEEILKLFEQQIKNWKAK